MKRPIAATLAFGLLFLLFIQMAGTLVAAIYVADLINISLDFKVLGLLFFFAPALLLPFRKALPKWLASLQMPAFVLLLVQLAMPYLGTNSRLLASGLGTGAALVLLPLLIGTSPDNDEKPALGLEASAGLALAVGLSVLLRTLGFGIDVSLASSGNWIGIVEAVLLYNALPDARQKSESATPAKAIGPAGAMLGVFLVLALVYFAFSAPSVISRWTDGNYTLIVGTVSLLSAGWALLALSRPLIMERISRGGLVLWNGLFTLSLVATTLVGRVSFPPLPSSPDVVVPPPPWYSYTPPVWYSYIPLVLMLLLFPVLYVDFLVFFTRLAKERPSFRQLLPGTLLGSLALVVLAFISIFTNVWGYIDPISTPFRNQFWLPFFLAAGGIDLLALREGSLKTAWPEGLQPGGRRVWVVSLGVIFLVTLAGASMTNVLLQSGDPNKSALLVMTYNIQAGNDASAERSYDRQLAVIQKISPDLLALQESDTARISLNNDDLVRLFAARLGYYSYYGPATITGTYGTAILSKYPLQNPRVIFSYSDTDEIGTTAVEIVVGGKRFTIFDVHPDGSDTAKMAFAQALLKQATGLKNVIILGDFNLKPTEPAYKLVAGVYKEAWASAYPLGIGADGIDMSGRIDHILVSPDLETRNPTYLQPPASASDHPVHWAEVAWGR